MLGVIEATTPSIRDVPPVAFPAKRTVLVVEDHPMLRTLIRCILESDGFAVETAENGLQGLELAYARRPSLVVLDLNLPIVDGETVAHTLRSADGPRVPVILVSANADLPDVARRVGAVAWLAKPFSVTALREPVRRVLASAAM